MAPPTFAFNTPLADLSGTWLELRCCQGVTYVPVKLLSGAAHPQTRLRDVLGRMRCKVCHDRPARAALVENPAASGNGGRRLGWVRPLS